MGEREPPRRRQVHVGEEMSDILLYLVRMADVCGVDLARAVQDKLKKNGKKYPSHLVQGSSQKYTAYTDADASAKEDQAGGSEKKRQRPE